MRVDFDELRRIVIAVDPAVTHGEGSDDTGIVVVAHGPHQDKTCKLLELTGRCPGHGYVLADLTCHAAPHKWAKRVVAAYDKFQADRVIAEVNNGGDMVGATIHAVRAGIPYTAVNASRGKRKRAEPVAALWEQGRMHFVSHCPELEDELTTWTQDAKWSPNRLDALVWGCSALGLIGGQGEAFLRAWKGDIAQRKLDPSRQESQEKKELARIIKMAPKFGNRKPKEIADGQRYCEHRWRGDTCVFCNQLRSEVEVVQHRGGPRG